MNCDLFSKNGGILSLQKARIKLTGISLNNPAWIVAWVFSILAFIKTQLIIWYISTDSDESAEGCRVATKFIRNYSAFLLRNIIFQWNWPSSYECAVLRRRMYWVNDFLSQLWHEKDSPRLKDHYCRTLKEVCSS